MAGVGGNFRSESTTLSPPPAPVVVQWHDPNVHRATQQPTFNVAGSQQPTFNFAGSQGWFGERGLMFCRLFVVISRYLVAFS